MKQTVDLLSSKLFVMSFSNSAIVAVKFVIEQKFHPIEAWNKAVAIEFPNSKSNQLKGCPKNTFLGLCEDGYVKGIDPGKYTRSDLNKGYGITALRILRKKKDIEFTRALLWKEVLKEEDKNIGKQHNSQMNVVLALWNEGLINV